jgi:hypothetical protein
VALRLDFEHGQVHVIFLSHIKDCARENLTMSEQVLVALLLVMIAVVLLLTVVVILLVYKLLKPQAPTLEPASQSQNEINLEELKKKQYSLKDHNLSMCHYHPEERARGMCAISNEPLCEHCLREHEGIIVGPEHFRTLLENDWLAIETILTTPESTEASAHLYDFKQQQWQLEKQPMYISTHYKINVNDDFIESHISLNVIKDHADKINFELQKFKSLTGSIS